MSTATQGTRKRLTAAQQALAADSAALRAVLGVAAKFGRRFPPLADEFESVAYTAICQAALTFDGSAGASFRSHAVNRAEGAMRDACRESGGKGFRRNAEGAPVTMSLDTRLDDGSSSQPYRLGDVLASDDEPIGWEIASADEIEGMCRRLPRKSAAIVRGMYLRADLANQARASNQIGLTESRGSQLHMQSIELLSERFANPEEIFMSGHASRFLEPIRITSESIHPAEDEAPINGHAIPAAESTLGSCPGCGRPYGKRRRCYACNPGLTPEAMQKGAETRRGSVKAKASANGHAKDRLPSVEALDFSEATPAAPESSAAPDPVRRSPRNSARQELRAMGEILAIVESLGPDAARRALAWVADRIECTPA